jgi:hypothetical protein
VNTSHTNKYGDLFFFTKQSDGYQMRMGIFGGNVGIGTTSPMLGKLQVETSSGNGVYAKGGDIGVYANGGDIGVLGGTNSGFAGVYGSSSTSFGVFGSSNSGAGVYGSSSNGVGVYGISNNGAGVLAQSYNGNIVVGYNNSDRKFHITNDGTYVAGSDFAEALPARGDRAGYEPGDVLVVSTKTPGNVERATRPYDTRVAGVYSTRPGMLGADKQGTSRVDADEVPVAIVGIVPTKVSAENGPVQVGDLLTTSRTPGYAMKASPILMRGVNVYRTGTILGKALEPLKAGKGAIKMLVMLR